VPGTAAGRNGTISPDREAELGKVELTAIETPTREIQQAYDAETLGSIPNIGGIRIEMGEDTKYLLVKKEAILSAPL
jgi:hypothetical protein